jgi:hypothetical protein
VSLEGTLETIALPDVLALLSVTAKTGELRIEANGGTGSVWFDAGGIAGFDVGNHRTAVDALFALLRLKEGSFKFHTGTRPINAIPPQDVNPLLEEAEDRLSQWPGIAAAVPSLNCEVGLQESVDGTVMLRPDQWQLVATIAGGHTVAAVLEARGLAEFDGCRALKELVALRLVKVAAPPEEVVAVPEHVPGPIAEHTAEHTADEVPGATLLGALPAPALEAVYQGTTSEAGTSELEDEDTVPGDWAGPEGPDVADLSEIWDDEAGDVIRTSADAPDGAGGHAEAEPEPDVVVADPVNRGLLLKFLGSARN